MDATAFVQAVKDRAKAIEDAIGSFFAAHPEIEADAAQGARDAVNDLKATAEAGVEQAAPTQATDINAVIDQAVAKIDADIANMQDRKDALLAAKDTSQAGAAQ